MQDTKTFGYDIWACWFLELDRDIRFFIDQISVWTIRCFKPELDFRVLQMKVRQVRGKPVRGQTIARTQRHRTFGRGVMIQDIAAQSVCGIRHDLRVSERFLASVRKGHTARRAIEQARIQGTF